MSEGPGDGMMAPGLPELDRVRQVRGTRLRRSFADLNPSILFLPKPLLPVLELSSTPEVRCRVAGNRRGEG